MRMRSFAKWGLSSGLISAFAMGSYSLYADSVLAKSQGRELTRAQDPKYFLPVTAGLVAVVLTVTAL